MSIYNFTNVYVTVPKNEVKYVLKPSLDLQFLNVLYSVL
jgi:hypothetical protein